MKVKQQFLLKFLQAGAPPAVRRRAGAVTRTDLGAAQLRYQPGLSPLSCRRIATSGPDPATRYSAAAKDEPTW